jgi:putative lipoic acid-binding regulatory protein
MSLFENLKEQLALQEWPNVYLFKFIVENTPEKVAKTTALFDETAEIAMHPSKNGKFVSISAKEMMLNVEAIMTRYEEAQKIEGIISL